MKGTIDTNLIHSYFHQGAEEVMLVAFGLQTASTYRKEIRLTASLEEASCPIADSGRERCCVPSRVSPHQNQSPGSRSANGCRIFRRNEGMRA